MLFKTQKMTKSRFVFFFLSIVLIPDAVISQNLETQIDKLYQVTENSPGFSIAIFKNNEIILEKQFDYPILARLLMLKNCLH